MKEKGGLNIADGHRIFYNFIRGQPSLGEATPAEKAGIKLNLKGNKWLEPIRRAVTDNAN